MNQVLARRSDIPFMKTLAEEGGDMPTQFGAQLLVPGVLYGLTTLVAWAMLIGAVDLPASWMDWLWIPATIIYVPILLVLKHRARSMIPGSGARVWVAAWTAMGIMCGAVLISLIMARGRINAPFLLLWPPVIFALYGGAWTMLAIVRRQSAYGW